MEQVYAEINLTNTDERRKVWRHTTTSVALVTSAYQDKSNVMACEWAIQCRQTPPQFLIVLGKKKLTSEFILKSMEFGLTFVADDQAALSHLAGSYSGHELDKLATNKFSLRPGKIIKAPIITGGLLAVECEVSNVIDNEERYIILGDVVHAEYRDDKNPIIYHNGKYFKLGENIPKSTP